MAGKACFVVGLVLVPVDALAMATRATVRACLAAIGGQEAVGNAGGPLFGADGFPEGVGGGCRFRGRAGFVGENDLIASAEFVRSFGGGALGPGDQVRGTAGFGEDDDEDFHLPCHGVLLNLREDAPGDAEIRLNVKMC